jgi:peptide/nickel transport system permease protein
VSQATIAGRWAGARYGFLHEVALFMRLLARNRAGFVGFLGVLAIVLLSVVGPWFIPLDMTMNPATIYQPPSLQHPLGTDYQGRDVWSQIVHGGQSVLLIAFLAAAMSTLIAVVFGALAAFVGGWVDGAITFITDVFLTVPTLPLLVVLSAFIKLDSLPLLSLIIGALAWPVLLRSVRAQVLSLRERDYVEAARALDLGTRHIVTREILPQMLSYIVISFVLAMRTAIYAQTALIFLGLVPLSGNNWAVMIQLAWVRGAVFFRDSLFYILSPVLAIAVVQLALVTMTRSLEEVFNPRLRTGG